MAEPDDREKLMALALSSMRSGDMAEVERCFQQLVLLDPRDAKSQNNLGICHLQRGDAALAKACFLAAVESDSTNPAFFHNLGIAHQRLDELPEAESAYRQAIALRPTAADSLQNLAQLELTRGRPEPWTYFMLANQAEPATARGKLCLAYGLFLRDRQIDEAIDAARAAVELAPNLSPAHALLGMLLQQAGDIEAGNKQLEKAIELAPNEVNPYADLVANRKMTEADEPLLRQMEKLRTEPGRARSERRVLGFALGKAYDDLKQFERAMDRYREANRVSLELSATTFDRKAYAAKTDELIQRFPDNPDPQTSPVASPPSPVASRRSPVASPPSSVASRRSPVVSPSSPVASRRSPVASPPSPVASRRSPDVLHRSPVASPPSPVFIVGMYRSGTTLVEQILSCHSQVVAGGELRFWHDRAEEAIACALEPIPSDRTAAIATEYLSILAKVGPDSVTDKQPENFRMLGPLRLLLPNARFIYCRRHPVDNALSLFMTYFSTPPPYASDPGDIVFTYREHQRLMAHWGRVLPSDRLLVVDYEDMVGQPEESARAMIAFCGLEWEEACLRPQSNPRAVRTASQWQVRQPIYQSSRERWKNYEPWLGEFRDLL